MDPIIEFHPDCHQEIHASYVWYESKSNGLGKQFLDSIESSINSISKFPKSNQIIKSDIRRCLTPKFPFGVLYKIVDNKIFIIAIMHLKRKPYYWLDRIK